MIKGLPLTIFNRSLSLQLSLLVVFTSAIVLTFFGWYRYNQKAVALEKTLQSNLEVTSRTLAASIVQPIFNYDMLTLEMICRAIMDRQEVASISIYENEETNLITLEKNEEGNIFRKEWFQPNTALLWEQRKIMFRDQPIGILKVGVTRRFLEASLISTMETIIVQIVALEILLVIPLFTLLRFRFIHPIQQLTRISSLIADGDLDQEEVSYGNNEIGTLSKTFFGMRDSIKKTFTELNKEVLERKQAEEELRNLRNYLTNIIDSMPSVLVGVDENSKVTQWNKTAEEVTGISAALAHGKNLAHVFPQMSSEVDKIRDSIRMRETLHEQKKVRRAEGGAFYEDVTIYPLIGSGVKGAVIRVDDITEKVRMEEMMIQSEKMLSVGGLAAGMAHEINNPLAGMMQTANVMANRLAHDSDLPANNRAAEAAGTSMEAIGTFMKQRGIIRMLDTINESGRRVAEIVNNMLSFARKSEALVTSLDLAELMDKTLELASTDYDLKKHYDFKQIKIVRDYGSDIPLIPCEGAKIQQVLLNILRNGAQAMQDETSGDKTPTFTIRIFLEKRDEMVRIEIEDNGPGIELGIRKRIFEPFFTTKQAGVGTGLGLSVSYFIVTENHGGEMLVDSAPGLYTKFIIRLPVMTGQTGNEPPN